MQLQDKAILVKLGFSLPGNSRTDAQITADTILAHAMTGKAGRWLKQIFPDEAMTPLVKFTGAVRTWNDEHTLPWSDEGFRILPTAHHGEYTDKMRQFRQEFEAVKSAFLSKLPEWENWARVAHNGTFDASLYDYAKLQAKFGMRVDFSPVPSGEDFRCDVAQDERDAMAAQVNDRVIQATKEAQADLWRRLADPLGKMVAKLREQRDDGKAPIFRDTLVSNLQDIAKLIPALNVTSDPVLAKFASEVQSMVAQCNPDNLRQSAQSRADTAKQAADILQRMNGYFAQA